MTATLLLAQLLNGLQYGVLLFLLAAGLTLVFGIMSFVIDGAQGERWFTESRSWRSILRQAEGERWSMESRSW